MVIGAVVYMGPWREGEVDREVGKGGKEREREKAEVERRDLYVMQKE